MQTALHVAAEAMSIADDWHLSKVEIECVAKLPGVKKSDDGMMYTSDLARYFETLADEAPGDPMAWRNVTSIEDVRAYIKRFPGDGVAAAWDSMLADMDDGFETYELADFLEEGEMQLVKGHC
jgi:hypothetical protein